MLRLPRFRLEQPTEIEEVVELLARHGERAMLVAGGTDLLPNMKHRLFEPEVLVSLARVSALRALERTKEGGLVLGATATLEEVAASPDVRAIAPALAQAAGLVAGPQLRTMGTLGGNVMLDTRCQWYNQTHFWRQALGFCLKKDGTACHVVAGGRKCVAAASNDSAPALMSLSATLELVSPRGRRTLPLDELWLADGIWNKAAERDELLVRVHVPPTGAGHRGAYGKLRLRGSIDFPLFACAARLELDPRGAVQDAEVCAVALVARPVRVRGVAEALAGSRPGEAAFASAVERAAELAYRQCRPMDNVPGDAAWRREMVPVYVRRTLLAAAAAGGPVHDA